MSWIDVTLPIHGGMVVWPGDEAVRVTRTMSLEAGDPFSLTTLAMTAHTGTHIDAPRHFVRGGAGVEAMPLDTFLGEARVVDVGEANVIGSAQVPTDLRRGERVLFKTRNSREHLEKPEFVKDYVYVSKSGAEALVAAGVRCVGIDYLSVGGFESEMVEPHVALLGAGVWILEGLDLRRIQAGRYELACLPLLIDGSDGAPARALLRRI